MAQKRSFGLAKEGVSRETSAHQKCPATMFHVKPGLLADAEMGKDFAQ
jgi:hypothetical protein